MSTYKTSIIASLYAGIEEFKKSKLKHLHKDKKFYEELSLADAIDKAANALVENGFHDHQYRVGKANCEKGAEKLKAKKIEIGNCKTFEEIFELTEQVKNVTERLGDLWSYDTALRIGFNKGLFPIEVYVQTGVKKGVEKIFTKRPKGRCLDKSIFPNYLQGLESYEIENFLCVWGRIK